MNEVSVRTLAVRAVVVWRAPLGFFSPLWHIASHD